MTYQEWSSELKRLTPNEYEIAKQAADKLIIKRIGKEPQKDDYERQQESLWRDPTFLLTIPIFFASIVMSGFEVFRFAGTEVDHVVGDLHNFNYGFPINFDMMSYAYQVGGLVLAELTMIVMVMRWRIKVKTITSKQTSPVFKFLDQFIHFEFLLAVLSMIFILYANLTSGLFPLLALLPPLVTIGLGMVYEERYTDWLAERKRVVAEYNNDFNTWQDIKRTPANHPEHQNVLRQSIYQKLMSKNQRYDIDMQQVDGQWKWLIVQEHVEDANWTEYTPQQIERANLDETELDELRRRVGEWVEGDPHIIKTDNYLVNMREHYFGCFGEGMEKFDKTANGLQGLKRMISLENNKQKEGE